MGLVFEGVQKGLLGLVKTTEWFNETFDHPLARRKISSPLIGDEFVDEGPDDLWPEEPAALEIYSRMAERTQEPEILVGQQWGLQLPSGEVSWSMYQGTHLNNPIDRVQMIARIQKTALDAGFSHEQLDEFMGHYQWVTRKQIASVTYSDLISYSLLDSEVSAPPPTPDGGTEEEGP